MTLERNIVSRKTRIGLATMVQHVLMGISDVHGSRDVSIPHIFATQTAFYASVLDGKHSKRPIRMHVGRGPFVRFDVVSDAAIVRFWNPEVGARVGV